MGAAHGKTKEVCRIHSQTQKEKGRHHLFCQLSTLLDLPQEKTLGMNGSGQEQRREQEEIKCFYVKNLFCNL